MGNYLGSYGAGESKTGLTVEVVPFSNMGRREERTQRWRWSAGACVNCNIWVCLKIVYPIVPNGFHDHYPVFKWLFHWEYTQHFQTNPYENQQICHIFSSLLLYISTPGGINDSEHANVWGWKSHAKDLANEAWGGWTPLNPVIKYPLVN